LLNKEEIKSGIWLGTLDLEQFSMKNGIESKREKEKQGTVKLLNYLLDLNDCIIEHDAYGKPFVKGRSEKISISHAHQWLVIAYRKNMDIGVDIEMIKEKIIRIRNKFLNANELEFASTDIKTLTALWCAKEALYKTDGKRELVFARQINILPFECKEEGIINGQILRNDVERNFEIYYRERLSYITAVVTNEV